MVVCWLALTVINGELTQDSIEALKKAKGSSSQGGILVLEAIGYEKGIGVSEEKEKTEIKLDKLNDLLQSGLIKLLFVCSRNKWRSLTAEKIFNLLNEYDVRSAGTEEGARVKVTGGHIGWADIIFVMEKKHIRRL
ncbi:Protein-tyrosine phosphatase, low molecular weight [Paenibacillus alvei TS-15]|uniref:Protein-tyrosine phosphatase, low molecular weight n=1 Tax=Paenibacillus alvei TS-15 TaxID=1117108 RepID=S9SVQ2_PAEAL|nr:Protein-tyrosine phosphatase, low molecular weight [Paenibacillus alvei TS-15]